MPQRQLAGETVLVDSLNRKVFVLNRVGGAIWQAVEAMTPRAEIVGKLVARFRVTDARAAKDVDRFLADLAAEGLVEPCPPDSSADPEGA